jgi:transcription elongation factor S-II
MHIPKLTNKKSEVFRKRIQKQLEFLLDNELNAKNVEIGIFNYAIQESKIKKITKKWSNRSFCLLYLTKLKSVMENIHFVIDKINTNDIKAQDIAFMNHQELCPEKWKYIIEYKEKIKNYEPVIEAATNLFTCKKCKSKKCTFYTMQTRSSDEPATIFVTCLDCGGRFKTN